MNNPADRPDWPLVLVYIVNLTLLKIWLIHTAGVDLHYDEAQYWEWSQHLDWGYYSKGPLIAWLIALAEYFFGHGEWQVRLFAWLSHAVFLALVFVMSKQLWHSRRAAWWSLLLTSTTPLYFILGMVMTTDNLVLMFWIWAVWACYRAFFFHHQHAWYEAGFAIGAGALAKTSIALLPLGVALEMVLSGRLRRYLFHRHIWIGAAILLLVASPMVIWNANHDWVTLRHVLAQSREETFSPHTLLVFFASQIFLLSPLVIIGSGLLLSRRRIWRQLQQVESRFLLTVSLAWLAFFIYKSLWSELEANWAAIVYVTFFVLIGGCIAESSKRLQALFVLAIGSSLILIFIMAFPGLAGLNTRDVPARRHVTGWQQTVTSLHTLAPTVDFILASRYQIAAQVAFYWPHTIPVYVTGSADRRFNQHDLWPDISREQGKTGLFLSYLPQTPTELYSAFDHCQALTPVTSLDREGEVVRTLYPQVCRNYHPIDWPVPGRY